VLNCEKTQFRAKRVYVMSGVSRVDRGSFTEVGLLRPWTFEKHLLKAGKEGTAFQEKTLSISWEKRSTFVGCKQPCDCIAGCVLWVRAHKSSPIRVHKESNALSWWHKPSKLAGSMTFASLWYNTLTRYWVPIQGLRIRESIDYIMKLLHYKRKMEQWISITI